jgi:NAD(P)-dependent dehydrogenase (short-subunit alcohol dehydrogenase family)
MDQLNLSVVVTGARRGLGLELARLFQAMGCQVGSIVRPLVDNSNLPDLPNVLEADISDLASVQLAIASFKNIAGSIDVLINNAAVLRPGLLLRQSEEEIRSQLEIDLLGPIFCCKAVLPTMLRKRAGLIINVGSIAATAPWPGQAIYSSSKGGLESLTRALASEYGHNGIRAIYLRVGPMDTDMLRVGTAGMPLAPGTVVRDPRDIAQEIANLVIGSRYSNGEVIDL